MSKGAGIVGASMRHKWITAFIIAVLVVIGIFGFKDMPKQEFPNFTIRQGVVVALYPGATAAEVESQVARAVEEYLFKFKEIDRAKSYTMSRDGVLFAMVELDKSVTNKDIVWSKIRDGLDMFKSTKLPKGVVAVVANDDFGDTSTLLVTLKSDVRSYREMDGYVDKLEAMLRQVESVSNLKRYGIQKEQVTIYLDRKKLAAYGLDYKLVAANLFSDGLTTVAGEVKSHDLVVPMHFTPTMETTTDIEQQIVHTSPSGQILRLKDIAEVVREYDEPKSYITHNGETCVVLSMEMREGFNVVAYGEEVDKILTKFQEYIPDDVEIERIVDQPKVVGDSVRSFLRDLVLAIVIVILVMMFLFPVRSALVAATTIPLTIFISVGIMFLTGIPLNTVTLAALIIVLGMIVDNSIVVIDAYLDYLDKGYSRWYAAVMSANNYAGAILLATLSLCIIFFPLLVIMEGIWLDFFRDFPWAFTICLLVSYLLAMLLVPFLEFTFIGASAKSDDESKSTKFDLLDIVPRGYSKVLKLCFRVPYLTIAVGVATIVGAALMFKALDVRMSPFADRDQFAVEIYMPQGTPLHKTAEVADSLERVLLRDERVTSVTAFKGQFSPRFHTVYAPYVGAGENYAQFIVNTTTASSAVEVLDEYAPKYSYHFPEGYVRFKQLDFQQAQIPLEVRLSGDSVEELRQYADSVVRAMHTLDGLVWIHTSFEGSRPILNVNIDPVEASLLGVSRATAQMEIASTYGSTAVTSIWEGGYEVPVILKSRPYATHDTIEGVGDQYVGSMIPSVSVPLRQIATVEPAWSAGQLVRRSGTRSVSIYADVERGHSESRAFKTVDKLMRESVEPMLPSSIEYSYGGAKETDSEVVPLIGSVVIAGVFIIFLFLLFNYLKIKIAVVALLSLLLALPGAIGGLWITGTPFGMTSILGVISLMGIVIRNTIMIFDHAEMMRIKRGCSAHDAAFEAGMRRMVPIFLTSATTAIGILPMVFGSAQLWVPMAIVIFVGTIVSMCLIVTILPVLYWKIFENASPYEG
ncbi:MAG: efflux RND transporter permease subunit [Rikenellaceae bacterium]